MPTTVDTSIYPKAQNPIETMTGVNNLMLGINQNRLFQQEFGSRKAIGEAYQRHTDAGGVSNDDAVLADIARDPRASFLMPELRAQVLERQRGEIEKEKEQLGLALAHGQSMSNSISGLLAIPPGQLKTEHVVKMLTNEVKAKRVKPEDAAREIAGLPTDEEQLRGALTQHLLRYEDHNQKIGTLLGQPTSVDTGRGTVMGTQGPIQGFVATANVPRAMSVESAAQQVSIFDPGTQTYRNVPLGSLVSQGGGPITTGPNPLTGGAPPNALGAPSPMGAAPSPIGVNGGQPSPQGQRPPFPGNSPHIVPAPAPMAVTPPPVARGPGVATSPPLGAAEAASATGAAAGQGLVEMQQASQGATERINSIQNAMDALSKSNTGKGTNYRNTLQAYLSAFPYLRDIMDETKDDVANYDKAVKYMQDVTARRAGSIGPSTNAGLASAVTSSASADISHIAAQDVLKVNLALERYQQLQAMAWDAAGLPPQEFNNWATKWKAQTDPRGLLLDQMPKKAREKMMEKASPAEDKRMENTYRMGAQNGLF